MKKIMKSLLYSIGKCISYLFSIKKLFFLRRMRDLVYSGLISKALKESGSNIFMEYPATFLGIESVSIGNNFESLKGLRIEAIHRFQNDEFKPSVKIGNDVSINRDCHIACINSVQIEDNVLIASKVFITDHSHGGVSISDIIIPPNKRTLSTKGGVKIHRNVWIGENAIILSGVEIGENAIIGAGSVVSKNVPANSIVAGVPARVLKQF
ncbi:DapH/DapD/GlmU-related protein [Flectobacillus roseus]|uniref:DapH/DapD/GlmU-related protein n=1 Tax=Flectobacillus roseus TaxID=502259 RepID=A0ABT6YF31_9BACT|nr:DapH/DapD/GlmU-related protein [Flectobacillus roseus]MDI9862206.1 DapH/DapD/GlmU-related protein [Flectobacillus roseus]